jgi:hypothetical protein
MHISQLALAVVNDRATETARANALAYFIAGGNWDGAVHQLLPLVIAEVKKPIYEGIPVADMLWPAAAEVLDFEVGLAILAKDDDKED